MNNRYVMCVELSSHIYCGTKGGVFFNIKLFWLICVQHGYKPFDKILSPFWGICCWSLHQKSYCTFYWSVWPNLAFSLSRSYWIFLHYISQNTKIYDLLMHWLPWKLLFWPDLINFSQASNLIILYKGKMSYCSCYQIERTKLFLLFIMVSF